MGKKSQSVTTSNSTSNNNNNKSSKAAVSNKKIKPFKEEKELADAVNSLLRYTTIPMQNNVNQLIECQKQISGIIDRIKILEDKLAKKSNKLSATANSSKQQQSTRINREVLETFLKWIRDNGGELNGCSIEEFANYELGLKVDQDIARSSLVIVVPRKLMMSVESASSLSMVKDLIDKIEILKSMPNVLLAIYLLVEKFSNNPFWKPYIDILPKKYNTVLYFSMEDLEGLKGSPTLEVALKQIKSIIRQYAYFHKLFWSADDPFSQLMKSKFTFNEYCWAVSTVMTRQNMIPSKDGATMTNALIPLWDLCNHSNGIISTDYNPPLDRSECLAFRDFKAGEQFFIFYGPRTNIDFFIHNGFVYEENENDLHWIRLGISKSDPLQGKRQELLNKLNIWSVSEFSLRKADRPIDGKLLAFLRVFNMDSDQLDFWIESNQAEDLQYQNCPDLPIALEIKSFTFLKTRLILLMGSYKTTIEEDEKILREIVTNNNNKNFIMVVKMRLCEKKIIKQCLEFIEDILNMLKN